jgi:hypothetical protein
MFFPVGAGILVCHLSTELTSIFINMCSVLVFHPPTFIEQRLVQQELAELKQGETNIITAGSA